MTLTDFVMIAIGELLLAGTFVLGVMVGVALKRKESLNDNGNSYEAAQGKWHHAGPGNSVRCTGGGRCGRSGTITQADPVERFAQGRDDLR
jgi:hypothetical protein